LFNITIGLSVIMVGIAQPGVLDYIKGSMDNTPLLYRHETPGFGMNEYIHLLKVATGKGLKLSCFILCGM
jgi:hypothetical protein